MNASLAASRKDRVSWCWEALSRDSSATRRRSYPAVSSLHGCHTSIRASTVDIVRENRPSRYWKVDRHELSGRTGEGFCAKTADEFSWQGLPSGSRRTEAHHSLQLSLEGHIMPDLVDVLRIGLVGLAAFFSVLTIQVLKQLLGERKDDSRGRGHDDPPWKRIFLVCLYMLFCLASLGIVGYFSRSAEISERGEASSRLDVQSIKDQSTDRRRLLTQQTDWCRC